jgi:hypothetical protein
LQASVDDRDDEHKYDIFILQSATVEDGMAGCS